MHPANETRRAFGAAGPEGSLLGGENTSENSKRNPAVQADPICAAFDARLTADLLAEAIEIAQIYIPLILRAVREADDAAILENFRYFDAAARCARKCAVELRELVSPFLEGDR